MRDLLPVHLTGWTIRRVFTLFAVLLAISGCAESKPSILWSFESAELSDDGSAIEIDAYGIPDPFCNEFDRVETVVSGDDLVVSLFYLGPEAGQFCATPCPMGTEKLVVPLDTPRDPSLHIVKDPATEPHCAETM